MLSVQSQSQPQRSTTSRKALNSLQSSPNGKSVVGSSSIACTINSSSTGGSGFAKIFEDSSSSAKVILKKQNNNNNVNNKLKLKYNGGRRRNSISLPDIHQSSLCGGDGKVELKKHHQQRNCSPSFGKKTSAITCSSLTTSTSIVTVIEEKENPHLQNQASSRRQQKKSKAKIEKPKVEKPMPPVQCSVSVQCNKQDEDMLFADSVEDTPYWKLAALKRFDAWLSGERENENLNDEIAAKDKENGKLRARNEHLDQLLNEYENIRKLMLESTQNDGKLSDDEEDDEDDEDEEQDSGLNISNTK